MMCRRCWSDSAAGADGHYPNGCASQVEGYNLLVAERECTPEQQAGEYWDAERKVDTRAERQQGGSDGG